MCTAPETRFRSCTWSRGSGDRRTAGSAELVSAVPEVEEDDGVDEENEVAAHAGRPLEDLVDLQRNPQGGQRDREIRGPPEVGRQQRRLRREDRRHEKRDEAEA